jgi:NAD(P)-dependent dehydrogenase (short-subunit alcohol dehydrogenase family)
MRISGRIEHNSRGGRVRFEGKKVLVTGAGSNGIGRAIGVAFAREGADVAVHYHTNQVGAEETLREIRHYRSYCLSLQADLATAAACRSLVRDAAIGLGGLDVLVHAAATILRKPIVETTDLEWERVFGVNLRASFACATEAASVMLGAGTPGRLVFIGSVTQLLALAGRVAYGASKAGVAQLARGMALELAPHRITVNVIAPGTIVTDMNRTILEDAAWRRRRESQIPVGRLGEPEDVVEAALFFASDSASYVTGNTIFCDGGMSLP